MLSQLGSNMLIFLLAIVIYKRTGSNAAVSGLYLSYGVPSLLFGAVGGAIVDRLDRRSVLVLSHATRALLILPVFFLSHQVAAIYLLVFVYAIIMQVTTPSEVPLIPQFVPKTLLVSANSLFSFTLYSGMAIGFIAAGPVLRVFGSQGAHILIFLLYLAAAVSVYGIPKQKTTGASLRQIFQYDISYIVRRLVSDLTEGLRYVANEKQLREAVLLLTGTQILLVLLGTLGPGFADTMLKIDVRDASLVLVGPAIVGILAGALWVGNKGYVFSPRLLVTIGVVSAGILLMIVSLLFALANTSWFHWIPHWVVLSTALGLFFLLGVANSLLDVPSNSMLQKEAVGKVRGRVYGILSAFIGGVGILPVVISGVLADIIGVGTVIFLLGVGVFLYGMMRIRYRTLSL